MKKSETFFESLEVKFPVFLAGMGGVAGSSLVAAVANAGCGGVLGCYKLFSENLTQILAATRHLTAKPIGVNFIEEVVGAKKLAEQITTVLGINDCEIYFTFFGLISRENMKLVKQNNRKSIVQVGSLEEASRAVNLGADAIVLQNTRAGGHHLGNYRNYFESIKEIDQLKKGSVFLVSGGIASGRDIAIAEQLGAQGVMCGTAFLCAKESNAHPIYKSIIMRSRAEDTVITDTFHIGWENRVHRVVRTATVDNKSTLKSNFIASTEIGGVKYPIPRFNVAVPLSSTSGDIESMALYCGTSCEYVNQECSAAEIIEGLRQEYDAFKSDADSKSGEKSLHSNV